MKKATWCYSGQIALRLPPLKDEPVAQDRKNVVYQRYIFPIKERHKEIVSLIMYKGTDNIFS